MESTPAKSGGGEVEQASHNNNQGEIESGGGGRFVEEEEANSVEEDEYHEDGLPDLVHETPEYRASSHNSSPSSSIDLLNTIGKQDVTDSGSNSRQSKHHQDGKEEEEYYNEADYLPNSGATGEEILTEVSQSRRGVFKVHYLDHNKHYVAPASAATAVDSEQLRYRSYLSLMPEDIEEEEEEEEVRREKSRSRERILSDFRALSYEDQLNQREDWAKELHKTMEEIQEIKEKLAVRTAWCGVLRRNLGISKWRRLSDACAKSARSAKAELQDAFVETKHLSSQSLKKAKDSFEQLSNEVRDRVRQGKSEITKRMSMIAVVEEEDEEVIQEELDRNSNKMKSNESLTVEAGEQDQELGTKA